MGMRGLVHKYACVFALGTHSEVYSLGSTVVQVLQLRERISELEDDVEKEGNQVKAVFMLREVLLVAHGQVRHVCVASGAPLSLLSLLLLLSYLLLPSTATVVYRVRCCVLGVGVFCWCHTVVQIMRWALGTWKRNSDAIRNDDSGEYR
jgi:hypothetical protein